MRHDQRAGAIEPGRKGGVELQAAWVVKHDRFRPHHGRIPVGGDPRLVQCRGDLGVHLAPVAKHACLDERDVQVRDRGQRQDLARDGG